MAMANTRPRRRRLALRVTSVGVVAAVAVLCAGVVLARFSAGQATQTNSFSSGTVTLTNNVSGACSTTNMLPGASPAACTLTARYGGTVSGWLGLDVLIETQAGNGGTTLYNPGDSAHDLQVSITSSSPSTTYAVPVTATACPSGAPAGTICYEADNELVSTTAFTSASSTVIFNTSVSLPSTTTTGYRGGSAKVIVTAHAAQSGNNSAAGCSAGQPCSSVHWS